MKKIINYESSSGVVHEGKLRGQHKGITKCRVYFNIHNAKSPRWYATNKDATCKACRPVKKAEKTVFALNRKISIFGIDTDEKARLATIRARILSMLESWEKHAKGETSKKDFYSALRWDLGDTDDDLHQYMHLFENKVWCNKRRAYVPVEKKLPVNEIKHSLDGKVVK